MNGSRAKASRLLADPKVTAAAVWRRGRPGRMNTELVESVISARGRPPPTRPAGALFDH